MTFCLIAAVIIFYAGIKIGEFAEKLNSLEKKQDNVEKQINSIEQR